MKSSAALGEKFYSQWESLLILGAEGAGKEGLWSSMLHEILRTLGQSWKSMSCVMLVDKRYQNSNEKLFITRDSQQENLTKKPSHLWVSKVVSTSARSWTFHLEPSSVPSKHWARTILLIIICYSALEVILLHLVKDVLLHSKRIQDSFDKKRENRCQFG